MTLQKENRAQGAGAASEMICLAASITDTDSALRIARQRLSRRLGVSLPLAATIAELAGIGGSAVRA